MVLTAPSIGEGLAEVKSSAWAAEWNKTQIPPHRAEVSLLCQAENDTLMWQKEGRDTAPAVEGENISVSSKASQRTFTVYVLHVCVSRCT